MLDERMIGRAKHLPSPLAEARGIFRVTALGVSFANKQPVYPLLTQHLLFADANTLHVGEDRSLDDTKPRTFLCGEHGRIDGHGHGHLVPVKFAVSSRRERQEAGYQRRSYHDQFQDCPRTENAE
jgi:hypothetical protein